MKFAEANVELDAILPTGIKSTADVTGKDPKTGSVDSSNSQTSLLSEETSMTAVNTNASALTNEQVIAAARATVVELMGQKDNESKIVSTLEKYMLEANQATASLLTANTKIVGLEAQLATARNAGTDTQENTNIEGANKDASKWHGVTPAAYAAIQKRVEELTSANAALKKEVDNFKKGDKKKDREDKLGKSKAAKSDKFKKRAMASKPDGEFEMSDADFESALAEFDEVVVTDAPAAAPAATDQATAAAGGGTPVAPPKDNAGPGTKQKAPSITGTGNGGAAPVPAPVDTTGPASHQTAPKMAHGTEAAPVAAAASATPEIPDLSSANVMSQATAALLAGQGPQPSQNGRKNYANAFGA